MVYINYLSTHCTFIYLVLKILKLLPTNDKPGERFRKVNLFLRVAEYKCLAIEKRTYFSTPKHWESYGYFKLVGFQKNYNGWHKIGIAPRPLALLDSSSSPTQCKNLRSFPFFPPIFLSRMSMIVRINVVLNRTVALTLTQAQLSSSESKWVVLRQLMVL